MATKCDTNGMVGLPYPGMNSTWMERQAYEASQEKPRSYRIKFTDANGREQLECTDGDAWWRRVDGSKARRNICEEK